MKPFSLKIALSTLVSVLVLASLAGLTAAFRMGSERALRTATRDAMARITRNVADKLEQRLDDAERANILVSDLVRSGRLDPAHPEPFAAFLQDVLEAHPALSSLDVGMPGGDKVQARRMSDGSISRRVVRRTATSVITTWHHGQEAWRKDDPDQVQSLAEGYDPRTRPWYRAALAEERMTWTGAYATAAGLNDSVANPVHDEAGRLLCVVAVDLSLADLSVFLEGLKVGTRGRVLVLDRADRVIALSSPKGSGLAAITRLEEKGGQKLWHLRTLDDLDDGTVGRAVRLHRAGDPEGEGFLSLRDGRGHGLLAAFLPEPTYRFTIGVLADEDEVMGPLRRSLDQGLAVGGLVLGVSLVGAYLLSRAVSRPLAALARDVARIRTLDLSEGEGVATAIAEVRRIDEAIASMKQGLRSFRKYVPAEVVVELMRQGREAVIEGERREISLFFSDIAGFTSISETLDPETLAHRLGIYLEGVTRILLEEGATVDKFIGDAVMAFWGAPVAVPDAPLRACRAALRVQAFLDTMNADWEARGWAPFPTRIGLHAGTATVGNLGYDARMNYTALGDDVNLASRLEGLNKHYGTRILASAALVEAAGPAIAACPVDLVAVKGRKAPVPLLEVVALAEDLTEAGKARLEIRRAAFEAYQGQLFQVALDLLGASPLEGADALLASRCRACLQDPPPADWDGVTVHHEK